MGLSQAIWNSRYWLAGVHVIFLAVLWLVFFVLVIAASVFGAHNGGWLRNVWHVALMHAYVPFIALLILWTVTALLANQPPLELTRSDPADAVGLGKLQNRLESLCIARNLPVARLFVLNYPSLNALIWGRNELRLYVTRQACDQLPPEELDALMAQQLGHLHNGDNHIFPLMSLFTTMGSRIAALALGGLGLIFANSPDIVGNRLNAPFFFLIAALCLLWLAFRYYGAWYGKERRFAADLFGIQLCQNAWALINIIERAKERARTPILPEDWRELAFLDPDPAMTLPWYADPEDRIFALRKTLGISMFGGR